jgi:hypothetical protein
MHLWHHDQSSEGGVAKNFGIEVGHPSMQDPKLKIWWDEAQNYRSGGFDRLVIPASYSQLLWRFCWR